MENDMRKLNEIIVHCAATREGQHHTVDQIRSWHKNRGWDDIGYHYVIYLDGSRHKGRPLSKVGAHVRGRNTETIGICYVGGVAKDGKTPKDTRTTAQKAALIELIMELMGQYPSIKTISGHNQYAAKACPSFDAHEEYRHFTSGETQSKAFGEVDKRKQYLQKLLSLSVHYSGQHDGIVGSKTREGIGAFQKERGLTVSEMFDNATVKELRLIEAPLSDEVKEVIVDAAAVGRGSKTDIASKLGGAAVTLAAMNEVAENATGTLDTVKDYLPSWLVPVLLIGGGCTFAYIWWDRRRKRDLARSAL